MQCTNVVQIALLGEKYGVQKTLFMADFVIIVISRNYTWNRLWYVPKFKKNIIYHNSRFKSRSKSYFKTETSFIYENIVFLLNS